jgi:hypothetical protein
MIAPEPFFQPRGTPFSEYHRLQALSKLGHHVDVLTYPVGEDVQIDGVRIYRTLKLPGVRNVKIGLSWSKVVLDIALLLHTFWRVVTHHYDCIHTHEEAGLIGAVLHKLWGYPHVYDMHSSLPEQLNNSGLTRSRAIFTLAECMERWVLQHSS